ncbi:MULTISPECIES: cytochrome C oxidase subunit IV family protein [Mammaliicoccus]|uniref:Cytochrome B6 n=1 Tax=Mammaliicoccus vitulinus TaxID=71237 RepID=A0A2T4PUS6_9STAP|nr:MULTISPECIES: cytochrome C oxidase subunit IV family protein [Mammaliicoccus]HAL09064.1 cytochrome B6 [Staphylococcus sp.]MBM6628798.1 cytochrome C oxidase subunit IV family protein [Mammaliicoccus vitulinus]MBO3076665.1 cytochrome C oxidase subunit IV family protein [Mammaliicoccus vitulinus]MEB7656405.1 cytochrome C oxidase subunit IV family protein [Mammaliicoccus vitulinus]PNZ39859.1 cytochrome B6 [Mammaliicoccus vitulinus]
MSQQLNHDAQLLKAYKKRKSTKEMRMQVTNFSIMIFVTFIAFALVAAELPKEFVIPVILGLAVLQVVLQFYYFMHMKAEKHGVPKLFMITGIFFGLSFVVTFIYIVWLGDPLFVKTK